MSRWLIIVGVLLLLGVGLWRRDHLAGSAEADRDGEGEVGATPTIGAEPVTRVGSGSGAHPAIEAGTLRLEGLVLDDADHPVGGARVTLDGARTTTTEADGSFAFDDLAPRDYSMTAELGDWYGEETESTLDEDSDPVTIEMVRGPSVRVHVVNQSGAAIANAKISTSSRDVVSDAQGFGLIRGADVGSEHIRVAAPGYAQASVRVTTGDDPKTTILQTVVLRAGAPLVGTVVDESGAPVADASVEIEAPNGDRIESVSADEAGVWTSENVAAGTVMLRGSSNGHIPMRDIVVQHDGVTRKTGIVIRVSRGGEVSGVVLDPQRKPVEGVDVSIGRRRATTGPDGSFVAQGLEPDSYDVVATTKDAASRSQSVKVEANGRYRIEITIQPSTLAGIVVDESGEPIEGVMVYARSKDPNGHGLGYSDERGRFDLGGVPPGVYDIEAQRDDQTSREPGVKARVPSGTRNLRLVLPELAAIAGRVVRDGVPVPYFGVSVTAPEDSVESSSPRAVRETNGTFTERGLTAGTWTIAIVGPGFERKVIERVNVSAGETLQLGDIVVGGGEIVAGRVVDDRGRSIEGATVDLMTDGASADTDRLRGLLGGSYSATTNARGEFTFEGVRPTERRKLQAKHPTFGISAELELEVGQREIALVIRATGSLTGLLANLTPETRVYGVFASIVEGPGGSVSAEVDETGRYTFTDLPPGEYDVKVRGQVVAAAKKVTVVAGNRAELDFELPRDPVKLIVEVTGDCSLMWLHERGVPEPLEYESCSSGTATFTGLQAGSYDLCPENTNCRPIDVPALREHRIRIAPQS